MSKAYEFSVSAYHAPVLDMDVGIRPRVREHAAAWPPQSPIGGNALENVRQALALPLLMGALLALPVALLATLLAAIYLYSDDLLLLPHASLSVRNALLTVSDLIVPLGWFYIQITNRRFGAGHAFAQLLAALAVVALVALFNPGDIDGWVGADPVASLRGVLAFAAAFGIAGFVAIVFFDATRGPSWWTAPLSANIAAALVFTLIYYPVAFAGYADMHWMDTLMVHFGLFFAEGIALLLPYYLLRSAMRPTQGMNGY